MYKQLNITSQIEIAKTRLRAARNENNPTEISVWESILKSLQENLKHNTTKGVNV